MLPVPTKSTINHHNMLHRICTSIRGNAQRIRTEMKAGEISLKTAYQTTALGGAVGVGGGLVLAMNKDPPRYYKCGIHAHQIDRVCDDDAIGVVVWGLAGSVALPLAAMAWPLTQIALAVTVSTTGVYYGTYHLFATRRHAAWIAKKDEEK